MRIRLSLSILLLLSGAVCAQTLPPIPTQNLPAPPSGGASITNNDVVVGDRVISGVNGSYGLQYHGNGTCTTNQLMNGTSAATGPSCVQPSFSNLSGIASVAQLPGIPLGAGTNSANPSVSGDHATGLYTPGSSRVGIVAGGVSQMDVRTNGIVIGTATGGALGAGTLNATGYFVNGNALTPIGTGTPNSLAGYDNSGNSAGVTVGTNLALSGGVLSATASGLPSGGLAFECLRKDATGTTTVWGNCLGSPVTSSPSGAGIVTQSALNLVTQSGLNITPQ